jgi:hypothetical protein
MGEFDAIANDLVAKKKEYDEKYRSEMGLTESDLQADETERSFVSDLQTIDAIADTHDAKARTISKLSIFLMLLFIALECMPVLTKAISPFDPYDAVVQEREQASILKSLVGARRDYAFASLSD